jgi:hypothetical protein
MANYAGTNVLPAPRWQAGMEYTAVGYYTLGGAVSSGDTFTWTNLIPAITGTLPVRIMDFRVWGKEMDTNATPTATLIAGDGTDTDGYVASTTWGDATGQYQMFGDGALIGDDAQASDDVVLTLGGTVATAASSGTVWVAVRYYCQ